MMDWSPLRREWDEWRAAGLVLPLWWRDDDAVAHTPALDRLLELADRTGLHVHLAIVPGKLEPSLAPALAGRAAIPVVHGWRHLSHAGPDQKKSEFGAGRDLSDRADEAACGLDRLRRTFGSALAPMFVPPWNRIGADMAPHLVSAGYRTLSTFLPRGERLAAPGLERINTHVDPIDWRGNRSLVEPQTIVRTTAAMLRDRRLGTADNAEPFGLLTHHLDHDDAIWQFARDWIVEMLDGPVIAWTHPTEGST